MYRLFKKLSLREQLLKAIQENDKKKCIKIVNKNKDNLNELNLSKSQLALLNDLSSNQNESLIFSDLKSLFLEMLNEQSVKPKFASQTSLPSGIPTLQKQLSTDSTACSVKLTFSTQKSLPYGVPTSLSSVPKEYSYHDNIDYQILNIIVKNGDIYPLSLCLETKINTKVLNNVLYTAVEAKELQMVEQLLQYDADVTIEVLHKAICDNSIEVIELLLPKLTTLPNKELITVINNGSTDIVKLLLDHKKVDVNVTDFREQVPLRVAICKGNLQMVELLLNYDASIERQDSDGRTALHIAASNGDEEIVKLLLQSGANINHQDNNNRTALHIVASNGNTKVVKLLLEHDANPNTVDKKQKTPLESAARHGHAEIMKCLFNYEARDNKEHLLNTTIFNNHDKATEVLLNAGVNPNDVCIDKKPLLYFVINTRTSGITTDERAKKAEIIKMLLQFGANVNYVDSKGYDPLFLAVGNGDYKSVDLLLQYRNKIKYFNASIILQYFNETTAVARGYCTLTEVLLEEKKKITSDNEFAKIISPLLHSAASYGHEQIVLLLLNNKVAINDTHGRYKTTALQEAAKNGYIKVVDILLNSRAKINIEDNQGTSFVNLVDTIEQLQEYKGKLTTLSACVIPIIVDETLSLNTSHRNILQQYQEVKENLLFIHYIKQGLKASEIDNTSDINNLLVKLNNRISDSYFQITNVVQTKCVFEEGFEIPTDVLVKVCRYLKLTDIIKDTEAVCTSDVSNLGGAGSDLISFDS